MAMGLGIIGTKVGMTRVFDDSGQSTPVAVINVEPNRVAQIKTAATDGYDAVQLTMGERRALRVSKPLAGHFAKANVVAGTALKEFRLSESDAALQPGAEVTVDLFKAGQLVDVTATSKGKGYAGGVKRHNFRTQDATHGNSLSHRALGSTGQCQTPGRVFKGKKMPGQLGNVTCTVQNQEVVRVDVDKKLLLIKGNVPGRPGGTVVIRHAVKAKREEAA